MTKRLFTLAMMTILALSAWADDNTVSTTTIWEFSSQTVGDLTENKNINGLWLRASSNGKIQFQNLKRSGNFSDGSSWTTMTNNENGVSAYIAANSNLTPTSSYFTSYNVSDGNRVRRCAAVETTVRGRFYVAIQANTSYNGTVSLYKIGSSENAVASAANPNEGTSDFTSSGNTATIEYNGEAGLYVLGSKDLAFQLCYMKFVPTYIIKASAGTGGSITSVTNGSTNVITEAIGENGAICEKESSVTFTATPNAGYHFVNWTNSSGKEVSSNAEYTISSLTEDQTLTANFEADKTTPEYTAPSYAPLTYNESAQNLVSAGLSSDGTFTYSTSADGEFTDAIPQGTDAGNYTVWYKLTGDDTHTDIEATEVTDVSIAKYNIKDASAESNIDDQTYIGEQIKPTAPAIKMGGTTIDAENYDVTYGTNTEVGTGSITYTAKEGSTNFTGTKTINFNIVASTPTATYTVTLGDHKYGPLSVSCIDEGKTTGQAAEGSTITVTAGDATTAGYAVSRVKVVETGTSTEVTVTDNTFTMPSANVTVSVVYTKVDLSVSSNITGSNGTLTFTSNNGNKFQIGNTVTITVKPDNGYRLKENTLVATYNTDQTLPLTSAGDNQYTFTVPGYNVTVAAEFESESSGVTEISSVNITGLSAPVKGSALTTKNDLSTSTEGVSISSISWNPNATTAAASTAYTATIVMATASGYQFASTVTANAISGKNASVTPNGDSQITIVYEFDATDAESQVTVPRDCSFVGLKANNVKVTADETYFTKTEGNGVDATDTYQYTATDNVFRGIAIFGISFETKTKDTQYKVNKAYLSCNKTNTQVTIPNLNAGQIVTVNAKSGSSGTMSFTVADGGNGIASENNSAVDNGDAKDFKFKVSSNGNLVLVASGSYLLYKITIRDAYTVSAESADTSKGSVEVTTKSWIGDSKYEEGTSVVVAATPESGCALDHWTRSDDATFSSTANPLSITVPANSVTLSASFGQQKEKVTLILTAGQSNTDGRVPASELPSGMTGLENCYWSYCNAKDADGTFTNKVYEVTNFTQYSPSSDCGENWGYDAVVYDLVGKALDKKFYVVKQAKGNTGVSSKSGGCGLYWSANDVFLANNTSANAGGKSLLKAFEDHIAASMDYLSDKEVEIPFMLWHQGECDSHTSAAYTVYHDSLQAVITHVRNFLADSYGEKYRTLPIICGTVAKNSQEYSGEVEGALYRLQEEDANFHVINMSNGTLLDAYHFDATSAQRLGKKMFNKAVEKELISGSRVSVEDIDATNIYPEGVYNFKVWSEVNLNGATFTNISLGDTEISVTGGQKVKTIQNMSGRQSDLELNGRFALSEFTPNTSNAQNSDVSLRSSSGGNCGLRANGGKSLTFSIQNLSPGDAVTITCTSKALKFLSENAFLNGDDSKTAIAAGTQVVSGTKYLVKSGTTLDFTFGDENSQSINCVTITAGEGAETLAAPTITSEMEDGKAVVTITATTSWGNAADIYYTTNGDTPTASSTKYTDPFTLTSAATVKAIAVYGSLTSDVAEDLVSLVEPSAAVTYDFMEAYAAEHNVSLAIGTDEETIYYNRNTDTAGAKRTVAVKALGVNTTALPVNGQIAWQGGDVSITDKGLKTSTRAFIIKNLKLGDKIRIEYDGELYYARSTYNDGIGDALKDLTTGDAIKNLEVYTVSSVDETNNYVAFWPVSTTTISQISINQELTQKVVPTPKITEKDASTFTYTISYTNGATLYYKKPGDSEYQSKTSGTSIDVQATKLGKVEAYATMNSLTSGTASVTAYIPTKAIEEDDVYDFAKVKDMMSADYVLGTHGFGDAVTIGDFTLYKPDEVVATTLDQFAFAPKLNASGKNAGDWRLLAAGRLRAQKSAIADTLAVLSLTKGEYITFTYSGGASLKYMSQSTAKLADGTDVLTSKQAYEVLSDGILLLTVPADESNSCDITVISISNNETVSAPTLEERTEPNKVTLRLGTSSFGKTVTAYYTTDGSNPTTSSTAVTKNGAISVDESCTIKAYCVSETGVASGVTEYTVTLPAASKSASAVYDWLNVMQLGDELAFASDGLTVYNKEYDSTDGWITKQRKDFNAATNFGSKVSVRNGASGLSHDTDKKTIRLTKPMAIHNLGVGDEIVIIYTGDGTLRSAGADEGDAFTINGKTATAGMEIPSGATIKVTKTKYANNYVVVTPTGPTSGKVYISSIYINHEAPTVANRPKAELASVDLDRMTSTYRFTFDEGAMLYYKDTKDNEVIAGSNTGTFDLVVAESAKLKAWEMNGTLVSDTLSVTVYAPTHAPSTTGNFDFTEASEDLPADIEVTLDAGKSVSVAGETLYKPSALTAATFDDKFAFTETGSSNKIRIRTNHQLVFAKGTNMSMALLNMKKGDIIAFNYTGSITFADPSQVSVESPAVAARAMTRTVSNDMTSGTAYVVQADGNILLNLNLTEESTSISKMYIAAAPTAAAPAAIDFATASENYEEVETGSSTSVYVYGKSSAQTFKRLVNSSDELPIDGMISTEAGSGEITADGIKAANRHIAIHNLAAGDKITISFFGGALTYGGHETYGNRVSVDGKTLAAQDTLTSGDVMVVEKVDYLNNYVVLKLDSKCCISGIFINRDEEEKVWAPTIVESGKNTVLITAGRSSLGYQVTTYYTTDGTDPSDRNGIGGPYDSYDVELLDGSLVPVKAISYSSSGKVSNITTFNIFADMRTEIIGVSVEDSKEQVIYDLQGRKVETPMEGRIYIIDGKKVLYRRK